MRVFSSSGPIMDADSREMACSYFRRMSVSAGGETDVSGSDGCSSQGRIYLVQG